MSLSLENGHVVFQFYLGEGTYGRIQTDFKYNRNKWVSVTLLRNGFFGEFYCTLYFRQNTFPCRLRKVM